MRTINRAAVWLTVVLVVYVAARPVIALVTNAVRTLVERHSSFFAVALLSVLGLMAGYYILLLGREARAFGNGLPISRKAIVIGCVGLGATLAGLLWLAAPDMA
jgi:hypothetical protein